MRFTSGKRAGVSGSVLSGRRAVAGAKRALQKRGIAPAAEFVADGAHTAGMLETSRPMQHDRRRQIVADHGDHLAETVSLAFRDEAIKERPPEAAPVPVGADIDRVIDGIAVGRTWPIGAGMSIAQDLAAFGCDEMRVAASDDRAPALADLIAVRRIELEACRAGEDVMRIDGLAPRRSSGYRTPVRAELSP